VDAGAEERLVAVNIAQAGDGLLVEEDGFYQGFAVLQYFFQPSGGEVFVKGFWPKPGRFSLFSGQEEYFTEFPGVDEDQPSFPLKFEVDPGVGRKGITRRLRKQSSAHTQVDDQRSGIVEAEEKVLAATGDIEDLPPSQEKAEALGRGSASQNTASAGIGSKVDRENMPSRQQGQEVVFDGFYFR